jgi:hypothetical protein
MTIALLNVERRSLTQSALGGEDVGKGGERDEWADVARVTWCCS